ncbi:MAG: hypothetical protein DMG13_29135 [Acidobacteria bacterium]|nr:MAG: hypothetical protein DMG13_29135 [Acidobacteriota bacterium]
MVYLGHFSFESHDPVIPTESLPRGLSRWRGYFSCMAEAESVERALNKFEVLLHRLARTSTVLIDVDEVYLDSCIEIKSIPKNAFMAYYKEMRGECQSLSTSLVGVGPNHHLVVYELTGEQCIDNDEAFVTQPFLVFRK